MTKALTTSSLLDLTHTMAAPLLEKTVYPAAGMELSAFQTLKVYPQNSGGCDLSGNCSRNGIILAGKAP